MALSTGKTAEVMFEQWKETYEHQDSMLPLVNKIQPDGGMMQNAGNVIWYPVEQHRPILEGWDLTGQETGIIDETYPAVLGIPKNDYIKQRADDLRTEVFWRKAAATSAKRQGTELNKLIAQAIVTQGSLFYRSNATSGYDFIAQAQAIMNERQLNDTERCFILNDRDTLTFASDLAARQTLQGMPEAVWKKGQLGQNIAGFDNVMTGSFLPNITGGADPAVTITGDQSFVPSGGTVNATTLVVTNVDYREASLVVNNSALVSVGDKFTLENGATAVQSIGLADKNPTNQSMTFTVIEITDATHIKVYPKPISLVDAATTPLQKAYANIDTQIEGTATLTRLNIDATKKTNLFFDKSAIEVIGGTIPAEKFAEFDGMKVITDSLANGLQLYMVYDGNIDTMTFRFRLFVWYGITVCNPSNCGCAVTYT